MCANVLLCTCYMRSVCSFFFFLSSGAHGDLPVLSHSSPTRRSSDLAAPRRGGKGGGKGWARPSLPAIRRGLILPRRRARRGPRLSQGRLSSAGRAPDL